MLRLSFRIALLFFVILYAFDASAEYFYIKDYNIDIYVHKNSTIDVKETIKVHFTSPRHGIFRYIPYRYEFSELDGSEKTKVEGKLHIFNIRTPGFTSKVYKKDGNIVIRIGRRGLYVNGDKTYKILYSVTNAVRFFKNYSKLYFNVIGNGWDVPIITSSFDVVLPKKKDLSKIKYAVYSGYKGSERKEKNITFKDGILECEIDHSLKPHQGVTLLMVFPKGYLHEDSKAFGLNLFLYENKVIFLPILVFFVLFTVWLLIGKDEKEATMTYYKPPEDITPAEAGVLIDDRIDGRDLISLIFYWASNGYLKIEEVDNKTSFFKKKDLLLKKVKDLPDDAKEFERIMFKGLFPYGVNAVRISSLKDKFSEIMKKAMDSLDEYIKEQKIYEKGTRTLSKILIFLSVLVLGVAMLYMDKGIVPFLSWLASAVIMFFFGLIMPKKTKKGLKEYAAVKGFKEFINKVEKDRLKKLLDEDPEYFYKTLSYAVAFGKQKKWVSKFSDLVKEPPNWYSGKSVYSGEMFSVYAFSEFINSSVSSMYYAFDTKEASNMDSFSDGGIDGGVSGGGEGGGGGGSW